ncbi:uncharacterized protein LOC132192654 [Neocloeon triangulifer]|uniref:uncharacterized protein LOC132192654 n=1 Tax=Neocloeon triangulifer TaxID=2078957 RepID=UPI00286F7006|nr:uncharacterized protein LOC132192654 [Neocloeon triangulifer]
MYFLLNESGYLRYFHSINEEGLSKIEPEMYRTTLLPYVIIAACVLSASFAYQEKLGKSPQQKPKRPVLIMLAPPNRIKETPNQKNKTIEISTPAIEVRGTLNPEKSWMMEMEKETIIYLCMFVLSYNFIGTVIILMLHCVNLKRGKAYAPRKQQAQCRYYYVACEPSEENPKVKSDENVFPSEEQEENTYEVVLPSQEYSVVYDHFRHLIPARPLNATMVLN